MAAIVERLGIRTTVGPETGTLDVPFLVRGAANRGEAHAAVQSLLTVFYIEAGIVLTFQNYDLEEKGGGFFEALAHYSRHQPRGSDQSQGGQSQAQASVVSFDTSGGTYNRKQFIGNAIYSTSGAPDFHGAINVNNDTVEGVDLEAPGFSWTETIYLPSAVITPTYINKLYRLSQHINNAAWTSPGLNMEFAKHDARFRYAQGSIRDTGQWEVAFHFHAEAFELLTIGSFANIPKAGQSYLWVRYNEQTDANVIVRRPAAVYVGQVYPEGNFADLNP